MTGYLKISREICHQSAEASHLANIANVYLDLGIVDQAKQYLNKSLIIFDHIKSPNAIQTRLKLNNL